VNGLKSLVGAEPLDASQQLPKGVEQMPNIDELLGGAREAITVRRVYGEPIEQEEMTLVPAAVVRGGGGGGGDSEGNGGGGFGVMARPVGAYVIRDGAGRLGARRVGRVGGRPQARTPLAVSRRIVSATSRAPLG
jgi:hypothetical protein